MRFACWITKASDTHSEYVIFIAFPRQQWSSEPAPVIRYTYITSVYSVFTVHFASIGNVFHQLNALVIKTLKYSKTV
jgi:hypothetical protein